MLSPEEIARISRQALEYFGETRKKQPPQRELWQEIESEILCKYKEQLEDLGINFSDLELRKAIRYAICLDDAIIRTLQRATYEFENKTHAHNYFALLT